MGTILYMFWDGFSAGQEAVTGTLIGPWSNVQNLYSDRKPVVLSANRERVEVRS